MSQADEMMQHLCFQPHQGEYYQQFQKASDLPAHTAQLQTARGGSYDTCSLFHPAHLRQKGEFQEAEDKREVGS